MAEAKICLPDLHAQAKPVNTKLKKHFRISNTFTGDSLSDNMSFFLWSIAKNGYFFIEANSNTDKQP